MWIRSQRRNTLVNINFMRVINDGNYCLICGATTDGCDCELGVYSTKEKAMEVLNDIYFRIKYSYIDKVLVYEMPVDEDVEV